MKISDPDRYVSWLERELVWYRVHADLAVQPQVMKLIKFLHGHRDGIKLKTLAAHINCATGTASRYLFKFKVTTGIKPHFYMNGKFYPSGNLHEFFQKELELLWTEAKSILSD